MGIQVDHNKPYSEETKEYLRNRGRGYLIPANERRFGEDGKRKPEEHEKAGSEAISPFYSSPERQAAVYDVGGAPLPGAVLDYDTGRVADRENGVIVEYSGPGHVPGAYDLGPQRDLEPGGFEGYDVDENGNPINDNIDEDIVDKVLKMPNKQAITKELDKLKVEYSSSEDRETLENKLAVALQDKRDAGK